MIRDNEEEIIETNTKINVNIVLGPKTPTIRIRAKVQHSDIHEATLSLQVDGQEGLAQFMLQTNCYLHDEEISRCMESRYYVEELPDLRNLDIMWEGHWPVLINNRDINEVWGIRNETDWNNYRQRNATITIPDTDLTEITIRRDPPIEYNPIIKTLITQHSLKNEGELDICLAMLGLKV